ncbi:hypothetical protein AcW1_007559 [Taiwanofungus camphoratus]|nr:hypothetical protein AcW2_007385 [Antrodia cinnamomea]KAI0927092.1 hypothetical protein AcV5_007720 [Antrodia cinnamomea]KAI0953309.1 hypothetical protein AcW1_007559 [Antrodia cinnamomea]
MTAIIDLPSEIIEHILLELDPIDVASIAQTANTFRSFVYKPPDQHLWRSLYLAQPLDDPRICRNSLGNPLPEPEWMMQLQRIIRARTVIADPTKCRAEERCTVLQTLIDLASNIPHASSLMGEQLSLNLVWLAARLRGGSFLDHEPRYPSKEECQLRARLHTCFGLTTLDFRRENLTRSRGYVYAMRHYKRDNDFGPYMMDGSGRVNWEHVQTIHHVMSMQVVPSPEEELAEQSVFRIFPMSLPFCQSVIPPGMDLDQERDWAGVAGQWQCSFCFCDHRELLVYNNYNMSDTDPLRSDVLSDPGFLEAFRQVNVDFRVLSMEPDFAHPTRPKINFAGYIDDYAIIVGSVMLTPDDQIRWKFVSR